ncbi:hypothetical protein A2U01_0113358, partial [Trifolium medium]|nr:hypothetical protein [Trifolium medium]
SKRRKDYIVTDHGSDDEGGYESW